MLADFMQKSAASNLLLYVNTCTRTSTTTEDPNLNN